MISILLIFLVFHTKFCFFLTILCCCCHCHCCCCSYYYCFDPDRLWCITEQLPCPDEQRWTDEWEIRLEVEAEINPNDSEPNFEKILILIIKYS